VPVLPVVVPTVQRLRLPRQRLDPVPRHGLPRSRHPRRCAAAGTGRRVSTANQHAERLLSAIIPDRGDLLERALRHLSTEHFPDPVLRNIFTLLERYAEVTAGRILTRDALGDLLRRGRADAGKLAQYIEVFDLLAQGVADEADFLWSLEQLRELAAERATHEALTAGMQILTRGLDDDSGTTLTGHLQARSHVMQRFAQVDRDLSMQEAPEGDMRAEGDDILADYATRKSARAHGRSVGVEFGIPLLDAKINGAQPGDLGLILGFTSEGKSGLCVQLAWNVTTRQGKNVVFLTTETLRSQIRRRLVARHSCVEHFGIDGGINSRLIKDGTLSPTQEQQLAAVVKDFTHNPGYGRCYIVQVPRAATIGYIESKLIRIARMFPIDLVIMDYLALLRPEKRRNSDREELGGILKEAKQLATTFADGTGVPFVSPWQVNRVARDQAERTGYYTSQATSETAEASNSADWIVSLLAPLDNANRVCAIKMQALKNRDGERCAPLDLQLDYATSRFFTGEARGDDFFFDGGLLPG